MTEAGGRRAIIALTVMALGVRVAALFQPMRFDESYSWAAYVGRSWGTIAASYEYPNNHVLYSLMAKAVAAPTDYAPWALRLPALLAGVACIPLLWLLGRRVADDRSALLASALAVATTPLVLYSTNARGYAQTVALGLAVLLLSAMQLERATTARWLAIAVLGAAGAYTIPVMLYPLGVAGTWLLLGALQRSGRERGRLLTATLATFALSGALAALLYLPIIRTSGLRSITDNRFVRAEPYDQFLISLPHNFLSTLTSWTSPLPWLAMPLLLVLALAGLGRDPSAGTRERQLPSLALAALLWCSALLLVMARAPFLRVWLFLSPLFLLAVARGTLRVADRIARRRLPRVAEAALALGALGAVTAVVTRAAQRSDETGSFTPAREVASLLAPVIRPDDRILAPLPVNGPLLYYLPRAGVDTAALTRSEHLARRSFLVLDTRHGQSLAWAVERGIVTPARYRQPVLFARTADGGEVWVAEKH